MFHDTSNPTSNKQEAEPAKKRAYRFDAAADSSKTRLNLVFEYKVDIVVCILVKVYNTKKKAGLIVTVVSITSLYFYYI